MSSSAPSSSGPPAVGIDLGTTYSAIAHLDPTGRPVTLPNSLGELLTPSALLFDRDEVIVGREAVRGSVMDPDAYAECFKRDFGGTVYHRKVRGVDVPPEVLSGFVLERMKRDAEQQLGPIREVVVTVPAFFDETRRKATQDAGRLAGLEVIDIINEPTAAALTFGYQRGCLRPGATDPAAEPIRVLVYDLGGGTFDVTILEIGPQGFRALATDGDVRLGGKDWDERLVDHLAAQFAAEHGLDPRSDPQDAAQLWMDAQEAKHALTERTRAMVVIFHAGIRMRVEITRETFEDLTRDLLERTETTTSLVIKDAGLDWSQIDHVLLVGGSVRMPMISEMLRRVTGREPDRTASPDEAVAHGAALYAATLLQRDGAAALAACQLQNINSHSLGVVAIDPATRRRSNVILIPKNTPIPCRVSRIFPTAKADQRSVKVAVVEGESHRPEECILLGECVVRGLPPGLPKGAHVHVEYSYAANGRIAVSARLPQVRQSTRVEIVHDQQRDLQDLATWRARLGGNILSDSAVLSGLPLDPKDRSGALRRLDALYLQVGRAAVKEQLPPGLARSQQAALAAARQFGRAQAELAQAEQARQSADGRSEAVRLGSLLARAKTAFEHARTQSDFSHLVLGRDCVEANYTPNQMAAVMAELQRLRDKEH